MTIQQFFFTAAYGIWFYIILCLCVKLILDAVRGRLLQRKMNRIRSFFAPSGEIPGEEICRELEELGKDLMLAECACVSFLKNSTAYSGREQNRKREILQRMLENAADKSEKTAENRCALISMAQVCGIGLHCEVRELTGTGVNSELADHWAVQGRKKEKNG